MDRVSLEELARFLAADDQVRRLLALSTNALFTTVDGAVKLATSSDSAWCAILVEWRDYFERVEMEQREELLSDLASRVIRVRPRRCRTFTGRADENAGGLSEIARSISERLHGVLLRQDLL